VRAPHAYAGIDPDSGRAAVVRTRGNADAHVVLRGADWDDDEEDDAQKVLGHSSSCAAVPAHARGVNYDAASVARAVAVLRRCAARAARDEEGAELAQGGVGLGTAAASLPPLPSSPPASLLIDLSHGNSARPSDGVKDAQRQIDVARCVADQIADAQCDHAHDIVGVLCESHLFGGRQGMRVPLVSPRRSNASRQPISTGQEEAEAQLVTHPTASQRQDLAYGVSVTDACLSWDDTVAVLDVLAAACRTRRANRAAAVALATAAASASSASVDSIRTTMSTAAAVA
jgi:3-deoxy-D-arabino-heptulosonate 7-phosphate (DAHP) synthase